MRNKPGARMISFSASGSVTAEKLAPLGTRTRMISPESSPPHPEARSATTSASGRAVLMLRRREGTATRVPGTCNDSDIHPPIEISLQDQDRRSRVNEALLAPLRALEPELAKGALRARGGEPLVEVVDGQTGPQGEFLAEIADLASPLVLFSFGGEGKAYDDALDAELPGGFRDARHRRPLAASPEDRGERAGDGSRDIAHGEADAPFPVINAQDARHSSELRQSGLGGATLLERGVNPLQRVRAAEVEEAAQVAAGTALDFEDADVLPRGAAEDV